MPKYETKQRRALIALLCDKADCLLSVQDIADKLKEDGISLSAIYRNLSDLESEGKIQRMTVEGTKKVYYRYTNAKECENHIHLSCSKCGKTFHLNIPVTNNLIDEVMNETDFKVDSSNTVLYGVCGNCGKQ